MSFGHTPAAAVAAGSAFQVLAELAAASRVTPEELPAGLAAALAEVADPEGETWLNLLGVPLDAGPPYSAERLVAALRSLDAVELRRILLGRYAWSWCTLAGAADLDAAAVGDERAIQRILGHPRYYAGHARASLSTLLGIEPAETQRRLVQAVEVAAERHTGSAAELAAAAEEASALLASQSTLEAVERLTGGFRYVPEVEAERVVLIPHLAPGLGLVLAQHRAARLVLYPVATGRDAQERLLVLGRALADPRRIEILALVGRGTGRASAIVEATGLTRSTVHHHLTLLRDAGLVGLEGNARAYSYVPRRAAGSETAALLEDLLGKDQ